MPKEYRGFTLIELLIATVLACMIILGIFSIDLFGRAHVMGSKKRTNVQNQISNAIEFMSKYVLQSTGDLSQPAITITAAGFNTRVDFNTTQTPGNLADDSTVSFSLVGNQLTASCVNNGGGTGCPFVSEILTDKVIAGFSNTVMPDAPTSGFYVSITNSGATVDIGLAGKYKPAEVSSIDNPLVSFKTKLNSVSSPTR
ncbi:MAG: prepilin-type N-terminal cleavage/methylation domain-containing protein [Candidatus Omnitrophica bacterium]|nr:prepilin-type N-terminal cleavage/methylation domain-containing protein [Candidatus Omnitrophota bacterium]